MRSLGSDSISSKAPGFPCHAPRKRGIQYAAPSVIGRTIRITGSPAFAGDDGNIGHVMDKTQPHPLFKLTTEAGPLIVFFVVNAKFHLFVATAAFMVAIVVAMIASYVVTRHVPIMALVTGGIVLAFGTLTLVLHDETFIKVKPTIIYGLFAAVLGGGLLFGRSFIAIMFDQMFNLTPQGWRILTLRWALFFFGMAILNEC